MNPTAILHKLVLLAAMLATMACTDPYAPNHSHTGHAPEGYFSFQPQFQASKVQTVISRGLNNDPLLDKIDNVFVFIFKDTNGTPGIQEDDRLEYREYYQYGVVQSIYLKKDETYFVYVVANLDESNIPDGMGSLHTFFDDVEFYGDLVNKYVQFRVISPAETGKMIMTTDDPKKALTSNGGPTAYSKDGIITIKYNEDDEVFAPHVDLYRLQARFVVNIYNRVISDTDRSNASGVTPTSINAANFPRKSFLVRHLRDYVDTNGDGVIDGAATGEFYSSAPMLLPAPQAELVQYNYAANDGYRTSYYTKQTVEYFCFENRRGGPKSPLDTYVPKDADGNPITEYEDETPIPTDIPDVYGRNELAPNFSSHLMLLSMTEKDVLRIFAHAGKGRVVENPDTPPGDDESNFDVDRNCVYHFNIIINGTKNVIIDSRSEYLTQRVLYYMPEDARVDAHYVDMPSYIKGKKAGIAKLQAGTVPIGSCKFDANDEFVDFVYNDNGVPDGWVAMSDDITNDNNWVRFSWLNTYKPTRSSTATISSGQPEPTSSTLYVTMRERQEAGMVDGVSSATPILHVNEFVGEGGVEGVGTGGVDEYPGSTGTNPPKRVAAIRVGFVEQPVEKTLTIADYDEAEKKGEDYPFFRPVVQYGLKAIGQLGGWDAVEKMYTSMLGVESIEEHTVKHYAIAGKTPDNNTLGGPWWWYTISATSENHPYDGKGSTIARYERYRTSRNFANGVPPVRGEKLSDIKIDNIPGFNKIYNPYSQTNAVDYCMRKNRDENGDGIISGDEVKWYLPSPAQAMQMYPWRDLFRGVSADLKESYTLNEGGGVNYIPFGPYKSGTGSVSSNYYWTTNEVDGSNALVVDFSSTLATNVVSRSKTQRAAVRCVRDVEGTVELGSMFYTSTVTKDGNSYTFLVADLKDHFPPGFLDNEGHKLPTTDRNTLQGEAYNTIAPYFLVSRWYVSNNNNTGPSHGNPVADRADTGSEPCAGYSEPGFTSGWVRPSQRELLFIYGYTGMLDNMLEEQYGKTEGPTTFHYFITNVRNNQQPLHWAMSDIGNSSSYWWINFDTGAASVARHKNDPAYRRCIRYLTTDEVAAIRAGGSTVTP